MQERAHHLLLQKPEVVEDLLEGLKDDLKELEDKGMKKDFELEKWEPKLEQTVDDIVVKIIYKEVEDIRKLLPDNGNDVEKAIKSITSSDNLIDYIE